MIRSAIALAGIAVVVVGSAALASPAHGTPASEGAVRLVSVHASVQHMPDGGIDKTYVMPGGEVMTTYTPPAGFRPLTASSGQLQEYGFPARPPGGADLQAWITAMSRFRADPAPADDVALMAPATSPWPGTNPPYGNWSGYFAGTPKVQNHTYVAVKGNLTVPSLSGCNDTTTLSLWIGLGGMTPNVQNLVQQGIVCGDDDIASASGTFHAFTEFANTQKPYPFCNETTWSFAAGHVLYQNMSYQASASKAYFYIEDETTGVSHSCSLPAPSGWSYDGNVAEWMAEAQTSLAVKFSAVPFSNAYTEVGSTSSWVTLGSQSHTKLIDGENSYTYCISPGAISGGTAFTETWHASGC